MWLMFLLGWLWFFMISMQTRIVAYSNHYVFHFMWTSLTSLIWVYIIQNISLDSGVSIAYIIGTGLGSISATYLHRTFWGDR